MGFSKKITITILCILSISVSLFALDTGKLITGKCRANLEYLNKATKKYLDENPGKGLPSWSTYENMKTMLMGIKYLPKDPVPPTKDCKYCFVSLGPKNFQWYCDLHGVIDGKKNLSFYYHEHRLQARIDPAYQVIKSYNKHVKNLYRWTEYYPTFTEKLKYNYNENPMTTIVTFILGAVVLLVIYKSVF